MNLFKEHRDNPSEMLEVKNLSRLLSEKVNTSVPRKKRVLAVGSLCSKVL